MSPLFRIPDKLLDLKQEPENSFRLAIVPLSAGAGASYVASKVLQNGLFSSKTPSGLKTLVELGNPYFYTELAMEKRFLGRNFYDFEKGGKRQLNMEMGVNWYLRLPGKYEEDPISCLKLIQSVPGDFIIYDCSGLSEELALTILSLMDLVYIVIDPSPSKLLLSEAFLKSLKDEAPSYRLVVNKFDKGVRKKDLNAFLETGDYEVICSEDLALIHSREYNCVLP